MRLSVVTLGKLADIFTLPEIELVGADSITMLDLRNRIGPPHSSLLFSPKNRIAVNGLVTAYDPELVLADGDEVAFLPPVSGG